MPLFDQKEDVLEIEMTPYGKHLYSKGQFAPAYYSFHDDEIIYDISYAYNQSETQTNTFNRITQDCVYLTPQSRYRSFEGSSSNFAPIDPRFDNYTSQLPLGNSSISSDYKPAWALNMINGQINSFTDRDVSQTDITNVKIPQVNLNDVIYEWELIQPSDKNKSPEQFFNVFKEGSELDITEDYILLSLEEANVDVLRENFDIEVFEVAGSGTLKPIYFKKTKQNIVDNILLDEKDIKQEVIDENLPYVDNYFEILFDQDIRFVEESIKTTSGGKDLTKPPYGDNC